MAQLIEESLLQAIKKDDLKAFNALTEKARGGIYRLGRFPVLSLLYLYKSRKILSVYEERFLKITGYEPLREPVEISKKFSAKAGKCLRLYLDEVVSPVEMLLILDKTRRLKRVYPLTKQPSAVKERLKSIYAIKYSLNVKFEGDGIILDRRPLSYREKKNIATACLCSVLAVTLAVGVPVTTVALIPEPVEGEVTKLSQIDFASKEEYTLKRDIVLPESFSVDTVNCTIYGGGRKLVFGKGVSLGVLNGKVSDIVMESFGDAIFTSVSENGTIENVTVNVSADVASAVGTATVAVTNYGTIDGVTVNVGGRFGALASSATEISELTFGGIVQSNDYKISAAGSTVYRGYIKNCTVNYSQLTLEGEVGANAVFGGVAGANNGYILDCTVNGEIVADTFDIAGVCAENGGVLSGNVNAANLSQTSDEAGWNPIVCGISITNSYAIENCENRGDIFAASTCGQTQEGEHTVSAAGIAYSNSRGIEKCVNSGAVTVAAENGYIMYVGGISAVSYGNVNYSVNEGALSAAGSGTAYVGGISAHSCAQFSYCLSNGDITVKADTVFAGGIFGFGEVNYDYFYRIYFGTAVNCISAGKIDVTVTDGKPSYIGGIVGCVSELGFNNGEAYYGGGVTGSYFTGECVSEVTYFGNIVGVCGAHIYESNSYASGNNVYYNFEGNAYTENAFKAFGATVSGEGDFTPVEDKGASAGAFEDIQNSEGYKNIIGALFS